MNKGFQILDAQGVALTLGQLDIEAAKFWGKKVSEKKYAYPNKEINKETNPELTDLAIEVHNASICGNNWKDVIGFSITQIHEFSDSWDDVIISMMDYSLIKGLRHSFDGFVLKQESINSLNKMLQFYAPHIQLIEYWRAKGYIPKQVQL